MVVWAGLALVQRLRSRRCSTPFREAYAVLQNHATTLREQTEPDIDNLLGMVTESVAAYKVCKERIDAADKASSRP